MQFAFGCCHLAHSKIIKGCFFFLILAAFHWFIITIKYFVFIQLQIWFHNLIRISPFYCKCNKDFCISFKMKICSVIRIKCHSASIQLRYIQSKSSQRSFRHVLSPCIQFEDNFFLTIFNHFNTLLLCIILNVSWYTIFRLV